MFKEKLILINEEIAQKEGANVWVQVDNQGDYEVMLEYYTTDKEPEYYECIFLVNDNREYQCDSIDSKYPFEIAILFDKCIKKIVDILLLDES